MKCPFCNKNLNNDRKHIYICEKNKFNDKIKTKFIYIKYNYPYISDKNNLYNEYSIKLNSFNNIRNEFGISYRNIDFLLNHYDIKKRDKKTSSRLISVNKYKKTCKLKYGVSNISKLKNIKNSKNINSKSKKIKDILIKNKKNYEWVKNETIFGDIFNCYNNKNENILKKEYYKIIKNYNNYWEILNDDEKNNILNNDNIRLEYEVSSLLDKLNISYVKNFKIGKSIYDFKINNTFLLIDINSDYWHANPLIYNENDILKFPFKKTKVKNIWDNDYKRKLKAIQNGYKIIYIWESDIKNLKDLEKKDFIINKIMDNL